MVIHRFCRRKKLICQSFFALDPLYKEPFTQLQRGARVYVHLSPYTRDNSEAAISASPALSRAHMASMAIFSTLPVLMASETNEDGILINPLQENLTTGTFD